VCVCVCVCVCSSSLNSTLLKQLLHISAKRCVCVELYTSTNTITITNKNTHNICVCVCVCVRVYVHTHRFMPGSKGVAVQRGSKWFIVLVNNLQASIPYTGDSGSVDESSVSPAHGIACITGTITL
jgi:hypothetical protein